MDPRPNQRSIVLDGNTALGKLILSCVQDDGITEDEKLAKIKAAISYEPESPKKTPADEYIGNILSRIIDKGYTDIAKSLITDLFSWGSVNITPALTAAARNRYPDVMELLLEQVGAKIDLNVEFLKGLVKTGNSGAMAVLLSKPSLQQQENKELLTKLFHYSIYYEMPEIAKQLLLAGADSNAPDDRYNQRPLALAVSYGQSATGILLLEQKADISLLELKNINALVELVGPDRLIPFADKLFSKLANAEEYDNVIVANIGILLLQSTAIGSDIMKTINADPKLEEQAQKLAVHQAYVVGAYFLNSLKGVEVSFPEGVLQVLVNKMMEKVEKELATGTLYRAQMDEGLLQTKNEFADVCAKELMDAFTPKGKKDVIGYSYDSYLIGVALATSYRSKYRSIMQESMEGKSLAEIIKFSIQILNALERHKNEIELTQAVIHTHSPEQESKKEITHASAPQQEAKKEARAEDFRDLADKILGSIEAMGKNAKKTLYDSAQKLYEKAQEMGLDTSQKLSELEDARKRAGFAVSAQVATQTGLGGIVQPARAHSAPASTTPSSTAKDNIAPPAQEPIKPKKG